LQQAAPLQQVSDREQQRDPNRPLHSRLPRLQRHTSSTQVPSSQQVSPQHFPRLQHCFPQRSLPSSLQRSSQVATRSRDPRPARAVMVRSPHTSSGEVVQHVAPSRALQHVVPRSQQVSSQREVPRSQRCRQTFLGLPVSWTHSCASSQQSSSQRTSPLLQNGVQRPSMHSSSRVQQQPSPRHLRGGLQHPLGSHVSSGLHTQPPVDGSQTSYVLMQHEETFAFVQHVWMDGSQHRGGSGGSGSPQAWVFGGSVQ
jgi:hypothetical protein